MSDGMTPSRSRRRVRMAGVLAAAAVLVMLVLTGEAAAQEFVTQPYGTSSVAVDERGTLIDVPNPPGGLYYRAAVDPTKTYRVTLRGERIAGSFALRYRQDSGELKYVRAPHGTEVYRFTGASTIELLLFRWDNSAARSYRVRALSIEDCTKTCQSDLDLKAKIVSDTPDLSEALDSGDTYGAARLLLGWASTNLAWADATEHVLTTYYKTAAEIYDDNFATGKRGVFCGGAADFLTKILTLFEIPNFRLDHGDAGWFTHSTAVVVLRDPEGKPIYRILDPTFGIDYRVAATDRPLSVPELFEVWRAGLMHRVDFRAVSLTDRRIVRDFDGDGEAEMRYCREDRPATTGCGIEGFRDAWRSIFLGNGYTVDNAGLTKLLAMEPLLDQFGSGVPADFQEMRGVFQGAVRDGSHDVHVAEIPLPPELLTEPAITGYPEVGATLTAEAGSWMLDPTRFKFSWARCDASGSCNPVLSATAPSYLVTGADARQWIELRVVARNQYGPSEEVRVRTAGPVPAPVDPPPAVASLPSEHGADRMPVITEPSRRSAGTPTGLWTAKLAPARAVIDRRNRVLDVLAPISRLASGRVRVELHAAGRRYRFTAPVDSQDGRIRFRQRIPAAQADLGTGILTIAYLGDADTRPQKVRVRAGSQPAGLRLARPTIAADGRLRAAGTVSRRARGVVRVQLEYIADARTTTLQFRAPIANGRWSLDKPLSQSVRKAIAKRAGTIHSYTLFSGYYQARMRGEMRSYEILAAG